MPPGMALPKRRFVSGILICGNLRNLRIKFFGLSGNAAIKIAG
jgi:hypothetical protein